jgi:hypothetical protein
MKLGYVVVMFMLVAMTSAPAHADCASTVNSAVDRMMDLQLTEGLDAEGSKVTPEMRKMAEDMANQMKPKMKAAMTKSCIDDAWSSEALKCMDDAATMASMEQCESKLTPAQKKSLDHAMNVAMGMDTGNPVRCDDVSVAAELVLGVRSIPRSAPKSQIQHRRDAAAALGRRFADLCITDRWSDETVSCMKSTSSLTDLVACHKKLAGTADEHVRGVELDALGSAGDCVKITARAVDRMTDVDEPTRAHMTWALAESCGADWWPASSLTCIAGAKTTKALERCEAKLSKSQRADLTAVMTSGDVDDSSLPQECKEYHAVIDRLASCDKMPAQSRHALRDAYRQAAAGWRNLPPDVKASLATACKAGRDAVFQSGKSLCGW